MAQPQNNIQIAAPGFAGLNTQDSPVGMDLSFAAVADNCVIDSYGRIASRNGFASFSVDPETAGNLDDNPAEVVHEFVKTDGSRVLIVGGDKDGGSTSELWEQDSAGNFTAISGFSASNNNWDFADLSDQCFMAQAGEPVSYYNGTTWQNMTQQPSAATNGLTNPDIILAAFGHLFVASGAGNKATVQWSTVTLNTGLGGAATPWTGSGSGLINVEEYWPNGTDEITALAAHNNFLVIFGRRSILVYNVPTDVSGGNVGPDYMTLEDSIENIGCVARDSVVNIGTDLLFLDASGVRSLNRTLQYKSVDIGDMSQNVRDDLVATIAQADLPIRACYSPEEAMYLLIIPRQSSSFTETFVFDTRRPLENGALRVTKWPGRGLRCAVRTDSGQLQLGRPGGMYLYTGGDDTSALTSEDSTRGITMVYLTRPQDFDEPARVKFPKQVDLILIGGASLNLTVSWFFDFKESSNTYTVVRTADQGAQWGTGIWDSGEWGEAGGLISTESINMWGSGKNIQLGFTGTISEQPVSIQELNIQALLGRIL